MQRYLYQFLERLGFSQSQSQIYLTLLEQGKMNISHLSQKTGIHRPRIYQSAVYLIEVGLISEVIKGKRRILQAEDPIVLERLLKDFLDVSQTRIHQVRELYTKKDTAPVLTTVSGGKFSVSVFDDILSTLTDGDTQYRYSSRPLPQMDMAYNERRKDIDVKWIQTLSIVGNTHMSQHPKSLNHELRVIPTTYDLFTDNISKTIYKNKVSIIDYNSQTSFTIEDEKFAQFEIKIFKLLFSKLDPSSR